MSADAANQPGRRSLTQRLVRHWQARRLYRRTSDWLWSLYNRLMISRFGRKLPLHGRPTAVRLAQLDKPLWIRLGTTDWLVLEEIFARGEYNPLLDAKLSGVRQIVDLGANIGLSLRLWRQAYPDARIIAVEPDDGNLAICRRNIAETGDAAVQTFQVCIAGTPRQVYLNREKGEWGISMSDQKGAGGASVEALTMPQLLERAGAAAVVDLLKCDIEGAEQELFADCAPWIGRVRNMLIELHHPYTSEMFLADLQRSGAQFDVRQIDEAGTYAVLLLQARHQ